MQLKLRIALVVTLVAELVIFALSQNDFVAADPLWYASIAKNLALHGTAVFNPQDVHPFTMRVGLTMPLALLYRAFGVSTFVTNLPCLLGAFGITAVAYAAVPTPRAKLIALVLCVTSLPLIRHMILLNVDLPSAALMGLSILCLARRDRGARWLAGAMAAWFAAFLVKEIALWCAPIWIYAFVVDARELGLRGATRRFAPAIAFGALLGGGYLAVCAHVWGTPLARFKGIHTAVTEAAEVPSYAAEWLGVSASRLVWRVPVLLAQMFSVALVPALVAPWLVRGRDRIWLVAAATIVLLYWFGPTSFSAYLPLPISARLLVAAVPFVLITAALGADALFDRLPRARLAIAIVGALVLGYPAARIVGAELRRGHPETDAFAALRADVAAAPARSTILVCGEPRCVAIGNFYFGFEIPPNVTLAFAADFIHAPRPEHATARALVNTARAAGVHRMDPTNDFTGVIDALHLPAITSTPTVRLYDAGDGTQLWDALHSR